MNVTLIGLVNSGRTTIFNALTGLNLETTMYPSVLAEPHIGMVKVPDARVDRLTEIFRPKKTAYADIRYTDFIGITKGDQAQNRKVFDLVKDADEIMHVVRCFEDESVAHPFGNIDPLRDVKALELELVLGDLELVEKRLERMEDGLKRGKKPDEKERSLLAKCKDILESEVPLRNVSFAEEEKTAMRHLQFLSIKPEVVVLNVGENDLNSARSKEMTEAVAAYFRGTGDAGAGVVSSLSVCGKIEMEIAQLPTEDAAVFLSDLGIEEPALKRLIRVSYDLLGFISFLTVGEDEVRAWTINRGTTAVKAAGKVHSDIERGFIRAETVGYDDFIACGDLSTARDRGLLRLEGKTYEVRDGDIINFRFHV